MLTVVRRPGVELQAEQGQVVVVAAAGVPVTHRGVAAAFTVEIVLMVWWSWLFFTGHWAS
jgi:hypothetical protein